MWKLLRDIAEQRLCRNIGPFSCSRHELTHSERTIFRNEILLVNFERERACSIRHLLQTK